MAPSLWVGFVLVTLVLIAGGAELYAQRRRHAERRLRFRSEFANGVREVERLDRAQMVLDARRKRLERRAVAPAPLPVIAGDAVVSAPAVEATISDYIAGD